MALFTNQATLSYNGNTVNSNIVTGNIVEVLSASKTAVTDSYTAGDDVTYVVSIVNSGTTAITGVTVTDNLGAYTVGTGTATPLSYKADSVLYYQNGVLQPTPTVIDTNPLTITGITVPADGNALLVYEAEVNSFAPLASGSTITNEVAVTAPGITSPVTAQETVTVSDAPVLSITKALSPENVTENSELTYTLTVQNTGNTAVDATDDVVITDTFDPILSDISVTLNGAVLPPASYTYNEATGEFATAVGAITVPAATYAQDTAGNWIVTPGVAVLTVTGTV